MTKMLRFLGMGSTKLGFVMLVSMIGIFYYTFIFAIHEQDFALGLNPCYNTGITSAGANPSGVDCIGGWGEYGRLWDWLNPFFWTQPLYAICMLGIQTLAMIPQFWLAKKGKIGKKILYANVFTSMLFRASYSYQDVTTTMFASLASWNPLFTALLILQKAPIGWSLDGSDFHVQYFRYLVSFEPMVWLYFVLMFWTVFPVIVWLKNKLFTKVTIPKIEKIVPMTRKDEIIADLCVIWIAVVVFYGINSFVNGGYLLQICHSWQTFNQCYPGVHLPW